MRDIPRHEDIAPRFAKERLKSIKAREVSPLQSVDEQKNAYHPKSLLARSEFLSYNGMATLIPKGSVLHVPDNCKQRMRMAPESKIVTWKEFFRRNRGWVTTFDVSRKQAEADEPISEKALEAIAKNPRVVIATLCGGPITVLHKEPAPEEGAENAGSSEETKPAGSKTQSTPTK